MDPIGTPPAPSAATNSPSTPQISRAASTIVFAAMVALLMMLGLYCTATRRRSIWAARRRLVGRILSSMSSRLGRQPADVSLPTRQYAKEEMGGDEGGTEDCPVCLVEFEEGEEVKVVAPGCEHVFHPVCIDRWLLMRNTCPVCRLVLTSEETYSVEEWAEGDVEVNLTARGEGEGEGEGEVVVNVEVVNMEGEGEVVVNVESDVLSRDMDGSEVEEGMSVESEGAKGSEVEVERDFCENLKEAVQVPMQSTPSDFGLDLSRTEISDAKMIDDDDDDDDDGESYRKKLEHIAIEVESHGGDS